MTPKKFFNVLQFYPGNFQRQSSNFFKKPDRNVLIGPHQLHYYGEDQEHHDDGHGRREEPDAEWRAVGDGARKQPDDRDRVLQNTSMIGNTR